ncbi:MAG: glyoxalase [Opitutae bacterium]|mgnify:CR=1 FL=1|jgi:catechol 2,3-dioxygenase-like lactoylglutathione lyase family enzyme|nr:glyoxalase [Opitutae bacterium]
MITKIRHTGIVVKDLNKSTNFYKALGFKISSRQVEAGSFVDKVVGLDNVEVETAKFFSPCGGMLELLQYHSHPVVEDLSKQHSNKLGCSHIAFSVASIKRTLEIITEHEGSFINPPAKSQCGNFLVAYCHDLDGILIEIVEELK